MQSRNNVQLTRTLLLDLLDDLQQRILQVFGFQIRLFIHGGAVMLLHPLLSASSTRRTTRDVDYIKRAFGHEWRKKGVHDAEDRLQSCINATAHRFRIGTDWMNADPDVALPFAQEWVRFPPPPTRGNHDLADTVYSPRGYVYDPIYYDAKQPNNVDMNTVYSSAGLILISVTMFWGVALKLVRYEKEDPNDIVAMLHHGTKLNGVHWTPQLMEDWVKTLCWPMGYDRYQPQRLIELRDRIHDAVMLLQNMSDDFTPRRGCASERMRRPSEHAFPDHRKPSPHSHAHGVFPPPPSFDHAFVSHLSVSHGLSPLNSPTLPISMPEPWVP